MELNQILVSTLAQMLNLEVLIDSFAKEKKMSKEEVMQTVLSPDADQDQVKSFIEYLGESVHVYSTEEREEFENNVRSAAKKEGIDEGVGNTYGAMDRRISEWSGMQKLSEDEKTMNFLERALKTKMEKMGQKPNEELERLKRTLEEKNRTIDTHLSTIDEIKSQSERQMKQFQIDRITTDAAAKLPIEADEKMLPAQREFLLFQLNKRYDVDLRDGQIVLTNKLTGKEEVDKKTASPKNIDEFLKEFAPEVVTLKSKDIKADVQKGGAGLKAAPIKVEQFGDLDLNTFKNPRELEDFMIKNGHSVNSPEVNQVLMKYYEVKGTKNVSQEISEDLY